MDDCIESDKSCERVLLTSDFDKLIQYDAIAVNAVVKTGYRNADAFAAGMITFPLKWAFWILNYFVVYFVAGMSENGEHLNFAFCFGMAFTAFAAWLSTKATLENTFLESTARIQSDRDQKVCTTGPYRIIRHPAYSGLLINCIGCCLIFPYPGVVICMAITAVIIVIRTALEDRLLLAGLEGYSDYAKRTKRLIPFIW